jgi:hypothetical protein
VLTRDKARADALSRLEALAAMGSSAMLEPLSGLYGLGTLATGGSLKDASDNISWLQEKAYNPKDPRKLQELAEIIQPIGEAYETGTNFLGDKTLDITGSPGLAAIAKASPEIVGGAYGVKQLLKQAPRKAAAAAAAVSDTPDMGRRNFIKNAGLLAGGAAVTPNLVKKGLLDVATPPAGKTLAGLSAKAALGSVSPKSNLAAVIGYFDKFPELKDDFIKGGQAGVRKKIDDMHDADGFADAPSPMYMDEATETLLRQKMRDGYDPSLDDLMDALDPEDFPSNYYGEVVDDRKAIIDEIRKGIDEIHDYNGEFDFDGSHVIFDEDPLGLLNGVDPQDIKTGFDSFSTKSTGRKKWDELLASDKGTVEYMTPDQLMDKMAKGQGTTATKAIARRRSRPGYEDKIDNLIDVLMSDGNMDMPVLDYADGGFVQDGFHRALAAKEVGIEQIPVAVIQR